MADKSGVSATQIAASSVTAIAAAYIGSRFGLTGTAIGAGIASVVTMGGPTLVQRSLERTHRTLKTRITTKHKVGSAADAPTVRLRVDDLVEASQAKERLPRRRLTWKWAVIGAASVFVIALGLLSFVELGIGHPLSGGNEGTTLTGLVGAATHRQAPPVPSTSHTPVPTSSTATQAPVTTTEPPVPSSAPPPLTASQEPTTTVPPTTIDTTDPLLPSLIVPPSAGAP
jgi:hypothetical protein